MTFDEFLDAELTGLRKYAAVLTGDPHRAQDVLAEALLRAHTKWARIGAMEFPAAYVRRMVTSQFLSDKRRWSVRMIRSTRTGELPDVHLSDPAIAADDRAQLRYLLAALAPRPRAAIVLRYYLGLDTDESRPNSASPSGPCGPRSPEDSLRCVSQSLTNRPSLEQHRTQMALRTDSPPLRWST